MLAVMLVNRAGLGELAVVTSTRVGAGGRWRSARMLGSQCAVVVPQRGQSDIAHLSSLLEREKSLACMHFSFVR